MSTSTICTRCGRQIMPSVSDGTGMPTNGYCTCPPQTGWGNPAPSMPILDWRDAELARLRAELEQAKADVERWSSSSGFFSDSLAMANESCAVLMTERDKYAAALVEIRGICTSMMDGWGQTVEVLDRIRKITYGAIKRQPTEPPHTPETFA